MRVNRIKRLKSLILLISVFVVVFGCKKEDCSEIATAAIAAFDTYSNENPPTDSTCIVARDALELYVNTCEENENLFYLLTLLPCY